MLTHHRRIELKKILIILSILLLSINLYAGRDIVGTLNVDIVEEYTTDNGVIIESGTLEFSRVHVTVTSVI